MSLRHVPLANPAGDITQFVCRTCVCTHLSHTTRRPVIAAPSDRPQLLACSQLTTSPPAVTAGLCGLQALHSCSCLHLHVLVLLDPLRTSKCTSRHVRLHGHSCVWALSSASPFVHTTAHPQQHPRGPSTNCRYQRTTAHRFTHVGLGCHLRRAQHFCVRACHVLFALHCMSCHMCALSRLSVLHSSH